VFARLPALVERAGNGSKGQGSITAFYTVLTEGDDQQDPIADSARAILDGHVVLSRRIAEAGQYPAVDIEASVSRVMHEIIPHDHAELARRFRQTLGVYQQNRDLINIGAYQKGSDPRIDQAIELWPAMQKFLTQQIHERVSHAEAVNALRALFPNTPGGGPAGHNPPQKRGT
jgi:flagellum-specific ATP synthase